MRLFNSAPNTRHPVSSRVHVQYDDPYVGEPQRIHGFADIVEAQDWIDHVVANSDVHPELFSVRGKRIA